jgi:hypothetical protein
VACYGRQLGWLVEAVDVQAQRQSRRGLGEADLHAMDQVHALAERVAAVKEGITSTINAITTTMRSTARRAIGSHRAAERACSMPLDTKPPHGHSHQ